MLTEMVPEVIIVVTEVEQEIVIFMPRRRCFLYFLQHENLLQRNIVARQVARKCCPYYWAFLLKKKNQNKNKNLIAVTV